MKIKLTKHAQAMLSEREIAREWIERTVLGPETVEPDARQPDGSRAFRSIPENGGKVLRVVYVRDGDDSVRILTAFFDRSRSK
jgi:hypothetical protein